MYIACLCILNLRTYSTKAGGLFKCSCCGGGGGFRRRAYGSPAVVDVHHPRGVCLLHVTIKKHGDIDDVHQHGDVGDVHHPRGFCLLHVTIKKHGDIDDVHQHGDVGDVHYGGSSADLPSRE